MIRCQNIYYMLSYAFRVLQEQGYREMALEEFPNVAELLAAILCRGVSIQVKRGLMREHTLCEEKLASPRGKIEISESMKTQAFLKRQVACVYDEFSVNAYPNRILKTTFHLLLKGKISKERKKAIKRLLIYFDDAKLLDIHRIEWNRRYDRNNQSYQMLISVCYMIIKGLLQTTEHGSVKMMDFLDDQQMSRLYEKFILEYFRKHFPRIGVSAAQIPWILSEDSSRAMLPVMQSDITLLYGRKILIIDAKYYSQTTQVQYEKHTIHSANLYQIFTYVKNKDAELEDEAHEVSGLLLYAKTDEEICPNNVYWMSGNKIAVRTLDLGGEFAEIARQLNAIAEEFLNCEVAIF